MLLVAVGLVASACESETYIPITPTTTPTPQAQPSATFGPGRGRPFAASSAFNVPIGTNPVIDANSRPIAAWLGHDAAIADLYEYGIPVYDADASTPRVQMRCTEDWGPCQLAGSVPMPPAAKANAGTDGHLVVVDWSTHKSYEYWQLKGSGSNFTTSWGGIADIDGMGTPGQAVGSGISQLAGLTRLHEITQGHIDHALGFATNNACGAPYRYPASQTDGGSKRIDCIPEGARVQLDPSINVDAIPGITPAEKIVARALQTYGAYAADNGGTTMAFGFESPPSGAANPYPAAGFDWDYYAMTHIPWNKLRVLRQWDGR